MPKHENPSQNPENTVDSQRKKAAEERLERSQKRYQELKELARDLTAIAGTGYQSNMQTETSRKLVNVFRELYGSKPYTGPIEHVYTAAKEANDYLASELGKRLNDISKAKEYLNGLIEEEGKRVKKTIEETHKEIEELSITISEKSDTLPQPSDDIQEMLATTENVDVIAADFKKVISGGGKYSRAFDKLGDTNRRANLESAFKKVLTELGFPENTLKAANIGKNAFQIEYTPQEAMQSKPMPESGAVDTNEKIEVKPNPEPKAKIEKKTAEQIATDAKSYLANIEKLYASYSQDSTFKLLGRETETINYPEADYYRLVEKIKELDTNNLVTLHFVQSTEKTKSFVPAGMVKVYFCPSKKKFDECFESFQKNDAVNSLSMRKLYITIAKKLGLVIPDSYEWEDDQKSKSLITLKKKTDTSNPAPIELNTTGTKSQEEFTKEELANIESAYKAGKDAILNFEITAEPKKFTFEVNKDVVKRGLLSRTQARVKGMLDADADLQKAGLSFEAAIFQDDADAQEGVTSLYFVPSEATLTDLINSVISKSADGHCWISKKYFNILDRVGKGNISNMGFQKVAGAEEIAGMMCLEKKLAEVKTEGAKNPNLRSQEKIEAEDKLFNHFVESIKEELLLNSSSLLPDLSLEEHESFEIMTEYGDVIDKSTVDNVLARIKREYILLTPSRRVIEPSIPGTREYPLERIGIEADVSIDRQKDYFGRFVMEKLVSFEIGSFYAEKMGIKSVDDINRIIASYALGQWLRCRQEERSIDGTTQKKSVYVVYNIQAEQCPVDVKNIPKPKVVGAQTQVEVENPLSFGQAAGPEKFDVLLETIREGIEENLLIPGTDVPKLFETGKGAASYELLAESDTFSAAFISQLQQEYPIFKFEVTTEKVSGVDFEKITVSPNPEEFKNFFQMFLADDSLSEYKVSSIAYIQPFVNGEDPDRFVDNLVVDLGQQSNLELGYKKEGSDETSLTYIFTKKNHDVSTKSKEEIIQTDKEKLLDEIGADIDENLFISNTKVPKLVGSHTFTQRIETDVMAHEIVKNLQNEYPEFLVSRVVLSGKDGGFGISAVPVAGNLGKFLKYFTEDALLSEYEIEGKYFSGTGNNEKSAKEIADELGLNCSRREENGVIVYTFSKPETVVDLQGLQEVETEAQKEKREKIAEAIGVKVEEKSSELSYVDMIENGKSVSVSIDNESNIDVSAALPRVQSKYPDFDFVASQPDPMGPVLITIYPRASQLKGYLADFSENASHSNQITISSISMERYIDSLPEYEKFSSDRFAEELGLKVSILKEINDREEEEENITVKDQKYVFTKIVDGTHRVKKLDPLAILAPEVAATITDKEGYVEALDQKRKDFEYAKRQYHEAVAASIAGSGMLGGVKRFLGNYTGIRFTNAEVKLARKNYEEAIRNMVGSTNLSGSKFIDKDAFEALTPEQKGAPLESVNENYLKKTLSLAEEIRAVNEARAKAIYEKRKSTYIGSKVINATEKFQDTLLYKNFDIQNPTLRIAMVSVLGLMGAGVVGLSGGWVPAAIVGSGFAARMAIREGMNAWMKKRGGNRDERLGDMTNGFDFVRAMRKEQNKDRMLEITKKIGSRLAGAGIITGLGLGLGLHDVISADNHVPTGESLDVTSTHAWGGKDVPVSIKGDGGALDAATGNSGVGKDLTSVDSVKADTTPAETTPTDGHTTPSTESKTISLETTKATVSAKSGEGATQMIERMMREQGDNVPTWFKDLDTNPDYQAWLAGDAKQLPEWAEGHEEALYITEKFGMSDYVEKAFDAESQAANAPTDYAFNESAVIHRGDSIGFTDKGEFFLRRANGETTVFTDASGNQLVSGGEKVFYDGPMGDTDRISGTNTLDAVTPKTRTPDMIDDTDEAIPLSEQEEDFSDTQKVIDDTEMSDTSANLPPRPARTTTTPASSAVVTPTRGAVPAYAEPRPQVPTYNRGGDNVVPIVTRRNFSINNVDVQASNQNGNGFTINSGTDINPRAWVNQREQVGNFDTQSGGGTPMGNGPRTNMSTMGPRGGNRLVGESGLPYSRGGRSANVETSPLSPDDLGANPLEQAVSPEKKKSKGLIDLLFSIFGM